MATILTRWRSDFKRLYERKEPHASKCRLISEPPKCLGYFLQKMAMKGDQLASHAASSIASDIKNIFDNEVVPLLLSLGMYPSFGICGYDEDGTPQSNDIPHDVPRFAKHQTDAQHKGVPVVWSQESTDFRSAFSRILGRTIGRAIVQDSMCSQRLKDIFTSFLNKEKDKEAESFAKKWSDKFLSFCNDITLEQRPNHIKNASYRLDYIDMLLAVVSIRFEFNSQLNRGLNLAVGSKIDYENNQGMLILDPCLLDELNAKLTAALTAVSGWKSLRYLIIPIFSGENWFCIRVEINTRNKTLSILIDDPRGGVFNKADKVPGDKDGKMRNVILPKVVDEVVKHCSSRLESYFGEKVKDRRWQFHTVGFLCKHLDQQGYLYNDVGSGVIVLSNMRDYLKINDRNNRLYSNRAFEQKAKQYKAKGIIDEYHMSGYTYEEVEDEQLEVQHDFTESDLYTLRGGEIFLKTKQGVEPFSEEIEKKRQEFAGFYRKKPYQTLYKELLVHLGQHNKVYLSYKDYLYQMLKRVPLDLRDECAAYFEQGDEYTASIFVTKMLFKAFNPKKPKRNTPYGDEDLFRKEFVPLVLKLLGINIAQNTPSSLSRKIRNAKRAKTVEALGQIFPKTRSSHFNNSLQNSKGLVRVSSVDSDESMEFNIYAVNPDGDCGYTAIGITREQAYTLISESLEDNNEDVAILLKPAIYAEILKQDFFDYLKARLDVGEEFELAFQEYINSEQKEQLFEIVDESLAKIALVYIEYDIQDKMIDAGWCHPSVLQVLAYLNSFRLSLWMRNPDDNTTIIPYQDNEDAQAQIYHYYNIDKDDCRDLLYINGNHFEVLELRKDVADSTNTLVSAKRSRLTERPTPKRHQQKRSLEDDTSSDENFSPPTVKSTKGSSRMLFATSDLFGAKTPQSSQQQQSRRTNNMPSKNSA